MTIMSMEESGPRRVAVITGATGGIGSAVAKALAQAGWRLVLTARSGEKLATLAKSLDHGVLTVAGADDSSERS
jgi:NADP-dependent 3-hydroxy acid dehydrogenase YdfG